MTERLRESPIIKERGVRLELYKELLDQCDGPQSILGGRRILDLSDVKEWLAVKMYLELIGRS